MPPRHTLLLLAAGALLAFCSLLVVLPLSGATTAFADVIPVLSATATATAEPTLVVSASVSLPAISKASILHVPAAYNVHSFLPPTPTPLPPPPKATDLGTLGGEYSVALDVNDRGQVVGRSTIKRGEANWDKGHAFLWQEGKMKDLGTLGGKNSSALRINDLGRIAGDSEFGAGAEQHGFFWAGGRLIDIGTLGGKASHTADLNDQGQIAGTSTTPSGDTHCFVWAAGVMTDLGTLGGNYCNALDINNQGQIVGASTTTGAVTSYDTHAFLWENGVMTDLTPDLEASQSSGAQAVNERGHVIGYRAAPAGSSCRSNCATLWANGVAINLNSDGQGLDSLNAINDRGQIVGDGNYHPCPGHCYPYWEVMVWDNGRLINLYVTKYRYPNFPTQLNNQGQIVINAMNSELIFWQDGAFFASASGFATAINDVGMVVGGSGGRASLWQIVSTTESS